MSRTLISSVCLSLTALLFGSSCMTLPTKTDEPEIAARYAFPYDDTCQSWLKSHRTGFAYCASPEVVLAEQGDAAPAFKTMEDGPTDQAALMERGEEVYVALCQTCHQENGMGVEGQYPPLSGSGEFYGDPAQHAGYIIHGLQGEIVVQGKTYNGAMPPQGGMLSDYDIAAVATYERNSWGNADGVVMPADVKAAR